jgi:hypothetical protein
METAVPKVSVPQEPLPDVEVGVRLSGPPVGDANT